MDEVITLENQIRDALVAGTVPDTVLAWANDILCNGWTEPGSRLERLRTIVASITEET